MIIQCRQCRTKYTFDDALMQGDGVWMRCSRCQHVFFRDNPLTVKQPIEASINKASAFVQDAVPAQGNGEVSYEEMLTSGKDADVVRFLDNVMEEKGNYNKEMELEIGKPGPEDIRNDDTAAAAGGEADDILKGQDEEFKQKKPANGKGFWKTWKIAVWSIFVILIIPAIIYFLIFPQYGDRFVKIANMYFGTPEPARPEVVTGQVKLQDIRQRILNSYIIGQIRVVEGTAVNQADYPISRIVIKGEIVDAYAVVLRERASYAGNILTDEELTTLSEEEILRILAQPGGRNNSNDKILPNGQIPFMIVFAHEPDGLIKTTLMTIGAERLL
jgi:predicted Zn finger-like uncharacterized protein